MGLAFMMKKKQKEVGAAWDHMKNSWGHPVQANASSWADQIIPGSARRLMMVITITGAFSCLYALLHLLSSHSCWPPAPCRSLACGFATFHKPHAAPALPAHHRTQAINLPLARALASKAPVPTNISHIVFGIAASASLWEQRKEYTKLWWRPTMRGFVWLDRSTRQRMWEKGLPPWKISENTDQFKYTHPKGHRSAIRISRIVSETFRLGLKNVRWFVMGDDDTIFIPENLVTLLSKYDHKQYYYIGSNSESHIQNIAFSYNMAYGGGGFAISYPLAMALEKMQDKCLDRYPSLFGSDDRVQACMAELGVPLTKERGFHQYDVYGNVFGLMAAHPVTPVVSIHHLDVVDPIFPNQSRVDALKHLSKSIKIDAAGFLQQSVCYDRENHWSISVSWGFAIQVFRGIFSPRELEMPSRTFLNWYRKADFMAYAFNTRPVRRHPCQKPILFFMETIGYGATEKQAVSNYTRELAQPAECTWKMASPTTIDWIRVVKNIDHDLWNKAPRRKCCRVSSSSKSTMEVEVADCMDPEFV